MNLSLSLPIQFLPILLAILAGFANGAYLSPLKQNTKNRCYTWIVFGLITFFALPLFMLVYTAFRNTFFLPSKYFSIILLIGLIYGAGMYLLTKSVQYIGLGIPFALSIATGTLSGSLFSIVLSGHFETLVNNKTLCAYAIFIISIFLYSLSLAIRDKKRNAMWIRGLVLCLFSSLLCASQGACLAYFADYFKAHGQGFKSQLVPWSLIFISCSLVFITSHYLDSRKTKEPIMLGAAFKPALLMSLLYIVSIALYTSSIAITASYSEEYLWVIFMGCIIFSSTFCSYAKGEWKSCPLSGNVINLSALLFLLVSLIVLTFSAR